MNFRLVTLLSLPLVLSACSGIGSVRAEKDVAGVYRVQPGTETRIDWKRTGALRETDGRLIQDEAAAQARIAGIKTEGDRLDAVKSHSCWAESVYLASKAQKAAVVAIREGNYPVAATELKAARENCERIGWFTAQAYFEAVVASAQGNKDLAKQRAKEFLDYADTTEPVDFARYSNRESVSEETTAEVTKELALYRSNARAYLDSEAPLALSADDQNDQIAKMYSNHTFRPGGNEEPQRFIFPIFAYQYSFGFTLGVAAYNSWGKYSIAPTYSHTDALGGVYALILRRSVFESANRDLNVDLRLTGRTWKYATFARNLGSMKYERVSPIEEGINAEIGIGATKRFMYPSIGFSTAVDFENDSRVHELRTYGTLYGFYDLNSDFDVFGGVVRNEAAAGITLLFLQMGYSFRNEGVFLQTNGINF